MNWIEHCKDQIEINIKIASDIEGGYLWVGNNLNPSQDDRVEAARHHRELAEFYRSKIGKSVSE